MRLARQGVHFAYSEALAGRVDDREKPHEGLNQLQHN
jgi:hypothetical protein